MTGWHNKVIFQYGNYPLYPMKPSAWMTTDQMLDTLHQDPGCEHEYRHRVSGILYSTYWWIYDPQTDRYGVSTDWREYEWCSREDLAQSYAGEWWMIVC